MAVIGYIRVSSTKQTREQHIKIYGVYVPETLNINVKLEYCVIAK